MKAPPHPRRSSWVMLSAGKCVSIDLELVDHQIEQIELVQIMDRNNTHTHTNGGRFGITKYAHCMGVKVFHLNFETLYLSEK